MDSGLGTGARAQVEQSDMPDGVANRHVSPVQPDSSVVADLESQLKVALQSQQTLRNELNSLHENQLAVVEQERKKVADSYDVQISSLQQSLMQTESSLQAMEKQLADTQVMHRTELENLLKKEEVIREQLLHERDQKHANHVARLAAELTRQQEMGGATSTLGDVDEQEAERLRMIKEKMREMHEQEKAKLAEEHGQENQKIRSECQQRMEVYRQQMEQLANSKIQEMHAQFMSAHQAVVEQKNSAEAAMDQWREEVERIRSQLDVVSQEKTGVEEKCQAMLQSHSAEIEMIRRNSQNLEQRLENWKGKAASLETRLERSGVEKASDLDELHRQNEEAIQKIRLEYEEKLQAQRMLAEDYQNQLEALHRQHEVEIESVKATHVNEVSLLEESISDASTNRASLEVAEEHMKSVQTQLEAYRTQESSFHSMLSELKSQHAEDIELLRRQCESQKAEEIEEVSAKFAAQMESLDEEMASLQKLVEAKHEDKEVLEALKAKHQKELHQVQTTLHDRHELAVQTLRKEMELAHSQAVNTLKQQYTGEVDALRKELEKELTKRVEATREEVRTELEMARDAEIDRLQTEHQLALKRLWQSNNETSDGAVMEAQARTTSLEVELQTVRVKQAELVEARQDLLSQLEFAQRQLQESNANLSQVSRERAQLSEMCQKYQNELKSLEVDLNIARSAGEQDKQVLEQTQEALVQWRARAEQLQREVSELDTTEKTNAGLSQQKILELLDQVAAKNIQVADLQADNDSLKTEVFSLTQKCQQHVAVSESLQKQLEGSTTASKEIFALQQQITELQEECSRLQDRVSEESTHSKDSEITTLRSHLDQANKQLMELESHWSAKYEECVTNTAREIETLRQEAATHTSQETEFKQQLDQYMRQLNQVTAENSQTVAGLNTTVEELQSQLDLAREETTLLQEEKSKLEQELKVSQRMVDEMAVADQESEVMKSYERLQQEFEVVQVEKDRLAHELAELQEEQEQASESRKVSEDKLLEQERTIRDLESQLSARELAFTEIQNEFGRQLTQAETRESSLRQKMQDSHATQEQLGTVIGEKSALEGSLSRARQSLTEKLQEKMGLERELNYHRTELERRLAEKQRLEELLFEKSRFEQELLSQKEQLQQELSEIESNLKLKDAEVEQERSEWTIKVQKKDSLIHAKEEEARAKEMQYKEKEQQHVGELSQLHDDLSLKHSAELTTLSNDLNIRHEKQVSTLQEGHRRQLGEVEVKHKKEVN